MSQNDKAVMQQALDALTESVDLVANTYAEAVDLYAGYPSRQTRVAALKSHLEAHEAAITALAFAIAQSK